MTPAERTRQWRLNNPERAKATAHACYLKYREKRLVNMNQYAQLRYDFVNKVKSKPCMDCGQEYHPFVMDLDHRPTEIKLNCISHLVNRHAKLTVIEEELRKCDVVCANCHRVRTLLRRLK